MSSSEVKKAVVLCILQHVHENKLLAALIEDFELSILDFQADPEAESSRGRQRAERERTRLGF